MIEINEDDIIEDLEACVYCGEFRGSKYMCCSENHFELVHVMINGDVVRDEEAIVIKPEVEYVSSDADRLDEV